MIYCSIYLFNVHILLTKIHIHTYTHKHIRTRVRCLKSQTTRLCLPWYSSGWQYNKENVKGPHLFADYEKNPPVTVGFPKKSIMRQAFPYHAIIRNFFTETVPDSKVHGANMGPTWVLSALDGPHVGPMNLAIRAYAITEVCLNYAYSHPRKYYQD